MTCGGELLDLSQLIPLLDLPFHLKTQFTKPSFWSEGRLEVTPTIVAGRGFQIILIRQGATKFLANVTTMPHFFFYNDFCHLHYVSDVICFIRLISCLVLWNVYKFCGDRWGLYQIPSNLVVFEWVGFVPWKILKPKAFTNVNVFFFLYSKMLIPVFLA